MVTIEGPSGPIEVVRLGRGDPVTVYAHGIGVGIDGIRLFASRVPGTRVFFHFRGHGATATPPLPWGTDDLADELVCVADAFEATQALGVSLGAGAITRALIRDPYRFEKVVLALPSVCDLPRDPAVLASLTSLGERMVGGDRQAVVDLLSGEVGLGSGQAAREWAVDAVDRVDPSSLGRALLALPGLAVLPSVEPLRMVTAKALVIAQEGDATHPVRVAERLVSALPDARLEVFSPGGLVWKHRTELRELLSGFLG